MDKEEYSKKLEGYKILAQLEIETTKTRHTTFTALLSISFILPGLALNNSNYQIMIWENKVTISQLVFFLGYLFYLFSLFHYIWYHRYSHRYRKALKSQEKELSLEVYCLRIRPKWGSFKFHFDWALYILGIIYGFITGLYIGWFLFLIGVSSILVIYFLLFLLSYWQDTEPLEKC